MFSKNRKGKKRNRPSVHLPDAGTGAEEADEEQHAPDWDNASSTLNDEDAHDRQEVWDDADTRKAAKAGRKAAKNQVRFGVVSKQELDGIQDALHPEVRGASEEATQGQGLFDNITIDKNIAFNKGTFKYSSLRASVHAKKVLRNNGQQKKEDVADPFSVEEISTSILKALGIATRLTKASRERKSLDAKLRKAILNDLVAFENEQAETMERMAGYWRYVNKRTYNQMVENNELWDWATGQKLLKVEEESDLDTIDEEDESVASTTFDGSTPGTTPFTSPETWDNDEDFEFPAGNMPLFGSKATDENEDGLKTPTQATYAKYSTDPEEFAERTRRQFDELHLSKLSFSPGRSPGPTLTFQVPSPSPSDYDPFTGDWEDCDSPINEDFLTLKIRNDSRSPLSPLAPNVKRHIFDGKKDTRTCSRAVFVRDASPPENSTPSSSPWRRIPSPTTIPPGCAEISNRFGNLDRELPAPQDDPKRPETPVKAKVITLALPPKKVSPQAEEGWEIQAGPKKNNKNFPALGGGKKKVGGGRTQKQGKVGASWANVAAAGGVKRR